jgi:hydrogenase expression/formation protein HypD
VSTIIGAEAYRFLAEEHKVPCVVTGFEPADILQGVEMLVRQVVEGRSAVENQYRRFVLPEGNSKAKELLSRVLFRPMRPGEAWGDPGSGLAIAPEFARFDAEKVLSVTVEGGAGRLLLR